MRAIIIGTFVLVVGIIGYLAFVLRSTLQLSAAQRELSRSLRELSRRQQELSVSLLRTSDTTREIMLKRRSVEVVNFCVFLLRNGWGIYRIGTREPFDGSPDSIAEDYLNDTPPRTYTEIQKEQHERSRRS